MEARHSRARRSRRRRPRRQRFGVVVAVLAVPLVLAGCGGSDTPAARDSAPTSGPSSPGASGPAAAPHWPAEGCETRSTSQIDYAMDARGSRTPEEAVARYVPEGHSAVKEPRAAHRSARWLVVDQDNVILRAVSVIHLGEGWLVNSVEQCSG